MSAQAEEHRRQLRRQIAERLTAGLLPRHRGQRVFGGRGEGKPCACCDQPITAAEVQYDLELPDTVERAAEQVRNIAMHLHCYRAWVEESGSPAS